MDFKKNPNYKSLNASSIKTKQIIVNKEVSFFKKGFIEKK